MSELLCVLNGGIQTIIPQETAPQLVYLDFDGAHASYHNRELDIAVGDVTVEDSGFGDGDIALIIAALNGMFDDVVFTSALPADGEFSTIYIGVTSAFDEYGAFLGLAETIDSGNQIRDDNAFVLLDSSADAELVVSVIAHETEHIVHGMDHGGEGLERFAAEIVSSGEVRNGGTIMWVELRVNSGGVANNVAVTEDGNINVETGGVANNTTVGYYGYMYVYGTANVTNVESYGALVVIGGVVNSTTVSNNGDLTCTDGCVKNTTLIGSASFKVKNSKITGYLTFSTYQGDCNGWVNIDENSVLDFDVSTLSPGNSPLVNKLDRVQGNLSYTLTVSDTQEEGTYKLAEGAAGFDKTITVMNTNGKALGTLTVGEKAKIIAKVGYVLAKSDNDLTLKVIGIFTDDVTDDRSIYITDGMLAYEVNVESGGSLFVRSGGMAEDIALNYDGDMFVEDGGEAYHTTVNQRGRLYVSSGGMAKNTTLSESGFIYVSSGGMANGVTVEHGKLIVSNGGTVDGLTVGSDGTIYVSAGGKMTGRISFEDGAKVYANNGFILDFDISDATADSPLVSNLSVVWNKATNLTLTVSDTQAGGLYFLADGADGFNKSITVVNALGEELGTLTVGGGTVQINGKESMLILDDDELKLAIGVFTGTLNNETMDIKEMYASGVIVNAGGVLNVLDGGTAEKTAVNNMGRIVVCSGGVVEDTAVNRGGTMCVSNGTWKGSNDIAPYATLKAAGPMTIADGAVVNAYNGSVIDFDITALSPGDAPLINDISRINGAPFYTVTAKADQAKGEYILAGGAANFTDTMTVKCAGATDVTLTVGDAYVDVGDKAYSLVVTDGQLVFSVMDLDTTPPDAPQIMLSGKAASHEIVLTASWDTDDAVCLYAVDGAQSLQKYDAPLSFAKDASVHFQTRDAVAHETDRSLDLMFGRATGKWADGYRAWNPDGYDKTVELKGKNVIGGVFAGSDDSTVLVLTDDKNGDALFLDDIYSAYPDGASAQKRISKVNEIFAGAGNDVVDLTSPRFDYADGGVTVHGGDGNDVIWANSGKNTLFGDAGNDRIVGGSGNDVIVGGAGNDYLHGGGGYDLFCFCGGWGNDTVEQLADGKVTLWFAEGDESKWDAAKCTYADGGNTVTVAGVASTSITLKFGDDSGQYSELLAAGVFDAFTTEKIFDGKEIALAST